MASLDTHHLLVSRLTVLSSRWVPRPTIDVLPGTVHSKRRHRAISRLDIQVYHTIRRGRLQHHCHRIRLLAGIRTDPPEQRSPFTGDSRALGLMGQLSIPVQVQILNTEPLEAQERLSQAASA